eukprot:4130775-Pyramimonas_sp.AAC.1
MSAVRLCFGSLHYEGKVLPRLSCSFVFAGEKGFAPDIRHTSPPHGGTGGCHMVARGDAERSRRRARRGHSEAGIRSRVGNIPCLLYTRCVIWAGWTVRCDATSRRLRP